MARKARASLFVALFQSVVPPSVPVRSSRVPSVARLALPLLGFAYVASCFVLGGRVLLHFVVCSPSGSVDSSQPSGSALCVVPPSASLRAPTTALIQCPATAPLSLGRFLPHSLWLLSVWLLCVVSGRATVRALPSV